MVYDMTLHARSMDIRFLPIAAQGLHSIERTGLRFMYGHEPSNIDWPYKPSTSCSGDLHASLRFAHSLVHAELGPSRPSKRNH